MHDAFQKLSFYLPKGHLSLCESTSFADQKHSFCKVKHYVFEVPDYQLVADKSFWVTC